jgi:hypothetical protein
VHTVDFQGSDGSHGSVAVPIDVTPPVISIGSGVFLAGSAPQVVCSDAGSGIASCQVTPNPVDNTIGTHSVHVKAVDRVGNVTEADGSYTAIYPFSGFFSPVDNLPTLNLIKPGQAVPVKFGLGGNRGLAIFATGYPAAETISCSTSALIDPVEQTVTAGDSSLSYDAGSQQYSYVWKTPSSGWPSGACRQLLLKLVDGATYRANFKAK